MVKISIVGRPHNQATPEGIAALRESLPAECLVNHGDYLTDRMLHRFLTSRNNDVSAATEMITRHLLWRRDYDAASLLHEDFSRFDQLDELYWHGFDKLGHPVLVWRICKHNPVATAPDEMIRYFCHLLETGFVKYAPAYKFSMVIDCRGMASKNMDWALLRAAAPVIENNYPERQFATYVCPVGTLIVMAWKVIATFIDPGTAYKIRLVTSFDHPFLEENFGQREINALEGFDRRIELIQPALPRDPLGGARTPPLGSPSSDGSELLWLAPEQNSRAGSKPNSNRNSRTNSPERTSERSATRSPGDRIEEERDKELEERDKEREECSAEREERSAELSEEVPLGESGSMEIDYVISDDDEEEESDKEHENEHDIETHTNVYNTAEQLTSGANGADHGTNGTEMGGLRGSRIGSANNMRRNSHSFLEVLDVPAYLSDPRMESMASWHSGTRSGNGNGTFRGVSPPGVALSVNDASLEGVETSTTAGVNGDDAVMAKEGMLYKQRDTLHTRWSYRERYCILGVDEEGAPQLSYAKSEKDTASAKVIKLRGATIIPAHHQQGNLYPFSIIPIEGRPCILASNDQQIASEWVDALMSACDKNNLHENLYENVRGNSGETELHIALEGNSGETELHIALEGNSGAEHICKVDENMSSEMIVSGVNSATDRVNVTIDIGSGVKSSTTVITTNGDAPKILISGSDSEVSHLRNNDTTGAAVQRVNTSTSTVQLSIPVLAGGVVMSAVCGPMSPPLMPKRLGRVPPPLVIVPASASPSPPSTERIANRRATVAMGENRADSNNYRNVNREDGGGLVSPRAKVPPALSRNAHMEADDRLREAIALLAQQSTPASNNASKSRWDTVLTVISGGANSASRRGSIVSDGNTSSAEKALQLQGGTQQKRASVSSYMTQYSGDVPSSPGARSPARAAGLFNSNSSTVFNSNTSSNAFNSNVTSHNGSTTTSRRSSVVTVLQQDMNTQAHGSYVDAGGERDSRANSGSTSTTNGATTNTTMTTYIDVNSFPPSSPGPRSPQKPVGRTRDQRMFNAASTVNSAAKTRADIASASATPSPESHGGTSTGHVVHRRRSSFRRLLSAAGTLGSPANLLPSRGGSISGPAGAGGTTGNSSGTDKDSEIERLRRSYTRSELDNKRLVGCLRALAGRLSLSITDLFTSQETIAYMESDARDKERVYSEMQTALATSQSELAKAKSEVEALQLQCTALGSAVETLRGQSSVPPAVNHARHGSGANTTGMGSRRGSFAGLHPHTEHPHVPSVHRNSNSNYRVLNLKEKGGLVGGSPLEVVMSLASALEDLLESGHRASLQDEEFNRWADSTQALKTVDTSTLTDIHTKVQFYSACRRLLQVHAGAVETPNTTHDTSTQSASDAHTHNIQHAHAHHHTFAYDVGGVPVSVQDIDALLERLSTEVTNA